LTDGKKLYSQRSYKQHVRYLELTSPTHEDFCHQMSLQISDSHQQM
jgi:hypothetical protein